MVKKLSREILIQGWLYKTEFLKFPTCFSCVLITIFVVQELLQMHIPRLWSEEASGKICSRRESCSHYL